MAIMSLFIHKSFSQTQLPSIISDITVLSDTSVYYYSDESLTVQAEGTLIIEKGVTLKMAASKKINVYGKIEARGTADIPVHFTATDTASYWGWIHSYSGEIRLNYAEISYATKCLYANYGCVFIKNCFVDNTSGAIGDDCISVQYADSLIISGCNINGKPENARIDALDLDGVKQGLIINNTITNFEDDGVDIGKHAESVKVENNYIYNCDFGISVGENSSVYASKNVIVACTGGAMQSHSGANVYAVQNTMYGNAKAFELHHAGDLDSGGEMLVNSCIVSACQNELFSMQDNSDLTVQYSISDTGILPGETNLLGNPLFSDTSELDFSLQARSPCINAGNPDLPFDRFGNNADMGAFEYHGVSLAVSNNEQQKSVYPNPTTNFITINHEDYSHCEIYTTIGVFLTQSTKRKIKLSDFCNSVFILRIFDKNNNCYVERVICRK